MPNSELMKYWNFDDADLGANRLGQLTEKQKNFLATEHKTQRNVFLGVGGVIAILFCCLPFMAFGIKGLIPILLTGDFTNPSGMLPLFAIGGFGMIFFGITVVIIAGVVVIYMLRANKKTDTAVKHVEGDVQYVWGVKRVRTPNSSVRSYEDVRVLYLNIGDKKFEVNQQLQDLIKENEAWVVYYTSYPFKFLSAEKTIKGA
jgi:hypothetical protein